MNQVASKILQAFWNRRFSAVAALAVAGLLFSAAGAKAGCGEPNKPGTPSILLGLAHPQLDGSWEPQTIVGLWQVVYTANDATFVQSLKTWHADGTEFENAMLPPSGGNVCVGVWKEIGRATVKLHHVGLMFGADGSLSNTFTVDEIDTVAPNGRTYSGNFEFNLYGPSGPTGGAPLATVKGTTAATRITVN